MSNFSTPSKVQSTIRSSDDVEWQRGNNRVKINNSANCSPPLDVETAKRLQVKVNCNFGEMMILLAHARRQYMSAFWSQPYFFKIKLPNAPGMYQSEWESFLTETINRPIRKSNAYFELHRSRWSAVASHGMGPQCWYHSDPWRPKFVALSDIRIPTDTTLDFENLDWFNIRRMWTPMELVDEVFPAEPKPNSKWNQKAIGAILQNYKQMNVDYAANHYDWMTSPEKFASLVRQDGGYWGSSSVPTIPLNHFYFKDETQKDNGGWFLRVVAESGQVTGGSDQEFLWTDDKPVAKKREHILHCQFGDLNSDAPFKVHLIRSLGFALLEPCFYSNLTRCRALQHLNDQFNILLRITDPSDKARAQIQEFSNMGVLRTGVDIVPQTQRHQVDGNLIEMVMAQLRQLQKEASSTYTQDVDTGTQKEQTAYQVSVEMHQVNALTSGLLMTAFRYATSEYEEICRRFCIPNSSDEDVKKFQKAAELAKIPKEWLNCDRWDVEACTPLGNGNPAMAMSQAQQLMAQRGAYDGTAQQEILHESTLAITGDYRKANRLAPINKQKPMSDATRDAQLLFGTLMQGVPIKPMEGLSPIEQFDALVPLYAGKITLIEQRDNMATSDEGSGLDATYAYLNDLVMALEQDPQQKQRVKVYMDSLGKLENQVKALKQRGAEKDQSTNGVDPVAMAKAQSIGATTAAKLHSTEQKDQQKQAQKDAGFVRDQRREDAKAFAQIQRDKEVNRLEPVPTD